MKVYKMEMIKDVNNKGFFEPVLYTRTKEINFPRKTEEVYHEGDVTLIYGADPSGLVTYGSLHAGGWGGHDSNYVWSSRASVFNQLGNWTGDERIKPCLEVCLTSREGYRMAVAWTLEGIISMLDRSKYGIMVSVDKEEGEIHFNVCEKNLEHLPWCYSEDRCDSLKFVDEEIDKILPTFARCRANVTKDVPAPIEDERDYEYVDIGTVHELRDFNDLLVGGKLTGPEKFSEFDLDDGLFFVYTPNEFSGSIGRERFMVVSVEDLNCKIQEFNASYKYKEPTYLELLNALAMNGDIDPDPSYCLDEEDEDEVIRLI